MFTSQSQTECFALALRAWPRPMGVTLTLLVTDDGSPGIVVAFLSAFGRRARLAFREPTPVPAAHELLSLVVKSLIAENPLLN
jgi:hypothetical protein